MKKLKHLLYIIGFERVDDKLNIYQFLHNDVYYYVRIPSKNHNCYTLTICDYNIFNFLDKKEKSGTSTRLVNSIYKNKLIIELKKEFVSIIRKYKLEELLNE